MTYYIIRRNSVLKREAVPFYIFLSNINRWTKESNWPVYTNQFNLPVPKDEE